MNWEIENDYELNNCFKFFVCSNEVLVLCYVTPDHSYAGCRRSEWCKDFIINVQVEQLPLGEDNYITV